MNNGEKIEKLELKLEMIKTYLNERIELCNEVLVNAEPLMSSEGVKMVRDELIKAKNQID